LRSYANDVVQRPTFAPIGALPTEQARVDPTTFETILPGVFAAGDVAHYEGRITIGLREAAIAANQCVARARAASRCSRLLHPSREPGPPHRARGGRVTPQTTFPTPTGREGLLRVLKDRVADPRP
jgi:hypothetical protein